MLTTAEASRAVADATPGLGTERVTLARAAGRVLRQDASKPSPENEE